MKAIFSKVCRVNDEALLSIAQPGIVEIPAGLLDPRQLLVTGEVAFAATVKPHRGQLITTVSRETANGLVGDGQGEFLPQQLLSYSHSDYVNDPDVDEAEAKRVEGYDLVVVAVIGDNRSALTVCRNIVSGCQDESKLVKDAQGALDASRVFLIED